MSLQTFIFLPFHNPAVPQWESVVVSNIEPGSTSIQRVYVFVTGCLNRGQVNYVGLWFQIVTPQAFHAISGADTRPVFLWIPHTDLACGGPTGPLLRLQTECNVPVASGLSPDTSDIEMYVHSTAF